MRYELRELHRGLWPQLFLCCSRHALPSETKAGEMDGKNTLQIGEFVARRVSLQISPVPNALVSSVVLEFNAAPILRLRAAKIQKCYQVSASYVL